MWIILKTVFIHIGNVKDWFHCQEMQILKYQLLLLAQDKCSCVITTVYVCLNRFQKFPGRQRFHVATFHNTVNPDDALFDGFKIS